MRIFVFLHIATMFVAVAMAYGYQLLALTASRSGDVASLRGVMGAAMPMARFIGPAFGLGVVFGVIAVFANGFDPLAPWLIIAYVLTVLAFLWATFFTGPAAGRIGAALGQAGDTGEVTAELSGALRNNFGFVVLVDLLIITALIADMVFKPLS